MSNDLEIIAKLEQEIGHKLPSSRMHEELSWPEKGGESAGVSYEAFCSQYSWGYFIDDRQEVVGLSLCGAELGVIPSLVFRLKNLRRLNLATNDLTAFPNGIPELSELEYLQLYGNKLTQLPKWILDLGLDFADIVFEGMPGIDLHGNPLESPPMEIILQGRDAVEAYFAALEKDSLALNEVKVLLVGDGGAGKTSLVKRIITGEFDKNEGQTDGINITPWEVKCGKTDVRAHMWDFGGQEIMHATHQFFLSARSVYVLVLDGRKEEDPEYWLKHIESFGGDSPILVALNKMDENPGFDVNRRHLQEKYKGILGFHRVSCEKNHGITGFKKALTDSLTKVDITQTIWPKPWFEVKKHLETMEDPFIDLTRYAKLCTDCKVGDAAKQDTLVRFLNDLGVVVHFPDFGLDDTHVLEPRWLTGAVYRIINSEELADGKGILSLRRLAAILKQEIDGISYPASKHAYIVEVMRKFELCFSTGNKSILVPDLLDVQEPEIDFDYENCLRFRIDYDFLPRSVMPRFTVRRHLDIKGKLRWRTGCVLYGKAFGSTAVVKSDDNAKRIYIFVNGDQRREFLTVVRSVFLDINRGFESLDFREMVPLPDNPEVVVSYDHLVKLEQKGIQDYFPDGADRDYKVKELLGSLYVEKTYTEKEFLELLKAAITDSDNKESALKKANDIVQLQPNFFGLGLNLNALVDKLFKRRKKKP